MFVVGLLIGLLARDPALFNELHQGVVHCLHADAATPQAIIGHARKQKPDVVHFSCHAGFDSERPQHSGFELSGGYLTVQRIITELRLSETRLATLSACKTHRVALGGGEEHVGLVQSLMIAGAKSIVASLWSVPENSTRALFEHFYRAVAAGESSVTALQKAMQFVRQQPDWEHPYYWAAFQVSGLGKQRDIINQSDFLR